MRATAFPSRIDKDIAWRTYGGGAVRLATVLVGPHDAHDVAAEAFLRVTNTEGWQQIENLAGYMARAIRNEAINLNRSRSRRQRREMFASSEPHSPEQSEPDVDLHRALARLSVRQRTVLFLAYWEGMTERGIAEVLAISDGTVHRDLERARVNLRKVLYHD